MLDFPTRLFPTFNVNPRILVMFFDWKSSNFMSMLSLQLSFCLARREELYDLNRLALGIDGSDDVNVRTQYPCRSFECWFTRDADLFIDKHGVRFVLSIRIRPDACEELWLYVARP